mmetsp:Transcript_32496/g.97798  ORF Transcript_32496/g.97798 Transcript_32496/m.97798 type:complete len:99 (-) Transcript_32496:167-463(-)
MVGAMMRVGLVGLTAGRADTPPSLVDRKETRGNQISLKLVLGSSFFSKFFRLVFDLTYTKARGELLGNGGTKKNAAENKFRRVCLLPVPQRCPNVCSP